MADKNGLYTVSCLVCCPQCPLKRKFVIYVFCELNMLTFNLPFATMDLFYGECGIRSAGIYVEYASMIWGNCTVREKETMEKTKTKQQEF